MTARGNVRFGEIFAWRISGSRSIQSPESQNRPTMFVLNDVTTSGSALPEPIALVMSSSEMLLTSFTVMLGYARWNRARLSSMALTSCGWLQPCQNVMVTGGGAARLDCTAPGPHAVVASAAMDSVTRATALRRWTMKPPPGQPQSCGPVRVAALALFLRYPQIGLMSAIAPDRAATIAIGGKSVKRLRDLRV